MSDSDLEGYDWANEMRYLQRSSEHCSDGEIYIPEPTQQDEMKRSAHPRYWDDVEGAPINLSEDFSTKISISWEELNAMGIAIGLSTAPSANSLLPKTRRTKHSLAVTNENPAKCRRF
ncbi:hypothetical protein C8J57DRAFT_1538233 [Mycena rebaudengoi]|nr:hypothetical protein C8J57DRAFT_1538233 [Mycena rebaudengoi]